MVYKNRKGAQGIGTLIIFIAMILVAAVAAGVLIQTASSLQSKSLDVGRQSQEKITTDIEVLQVYAEGTNDSTINGAIPGPADEVTIVVRLGAGSEPIKLSDLIVKFDTTDGSQTLKNTTTGPSEEFYNVTYLIDGTQNKPGYLVSGDMVEFSFNPSYDVGEAESATVRLVAKSGAVKPIDITTPSAMVEATSFLYP
ncbi:MAG: archaellin/type IV pilin N-terminal domain-containing protein [Nanoarchaeota archaeon]